VGQNIQDKPLLRDLNAKKKSFPGGQGYISGPVRASGGHAGFFGWFSHADQVTFARPDNILRAKYLWRECHVGFVLSFTDLKQHGVSVDMSGNAVKSTAEEIQLVKDWLAAVIEDEFGESLSIEVQNALWADGTQDAKAIVGVTGILDDNPASGLIGSLDRAAYAWWRHRVNLNMPFSPANTSLIKKLKAEIRQLRRYGGRPDSIYAGSDFIGALEDELVAKGLFSQEGFSRKENTDIAINNIRIRGVGEVQYEPWLDDNGYAKRAYVLDSNHAKLMPMKGQDMMAHKAVRPYDQFVLFKSVTGTMALCFDQLNCHGVYAIA
jgi:hypothetical protein